MAALLQLLIIGASVIFCCGAVPALFGYLIVRNVFPEHFQRRNRDDDE